MGVRQNDIWSLAMRETNSRRPDGVIFGIGAPLTETMLK